MEIGRRLVAVRMFALIALMVAGITFAATAHGNPVLPPDADPPAEHTTATPTVIANDGGSRWSYQDAADASAKREGGYLPFNDTDRYAPDGADYALTGGYYDQADFAGFGPHGGYDTATNKCKACHAVHRAEGTHYLLRATTQDDACNYCHIGAGAKSAQLVYSGNPAGVDTPNGHTIGSGPLIPDSTVQMQSVEVEVRPGQANTRVKIRTYEEQRKGLYRVVASRVGQPSHPVISGADAVEWSRLGPMPLSCSSCHQVHNATTQVWRPQAFDGAGATDARGFLKYGYKLLRRFPGASAAGNPAAGATVPTEALAKVPESRLTPDVNYSTNVSFEDSYTENSETFSQPDWVVGQGFSGGQGGSATPVNQYTLTVWCADCHNLNIGGGPTQLGDSELGYFPMHAERTHPVPSIAAVAGSLTGGFQCYSCHRADLDYGTACSACHYTPARYRIAAPASDFPHADSDQSYKLLGAFSVNVPRLAQGAFDYEYLPTDITADNLDAVCLRCHAVAHLPYGGEALGHGVPSEYAQCATCHGSDSGVIHDATPQGCNACHAAATLTFDCATCHFATFAEHPVDPAAHVVSAPYDTECGTCHGTDAAATHAAAPDGCFECHGAAQLTTECSACHFATFAEHPISAGAHTAAAGTGTSVITGGMGVGGGWSVPSGWTGAWPVSQSYSQRCNQCHSMDLLTEHAKASSSSAAQGCVACHPTPASTLTGGWAGGCQQGGCHPTIHTRTTMATAHTFGDAEWNLGCSGCHTRRDINQPWSWISDYGQVHDFLIHNYFGQPQLDGCSWCHTPAVVPTRGVSCSRGGCHGPDWLYRHDVAWISPVPVD
jgi:hypothetical protein